MKTKVYYSSKDFNVDGAPLLKAGKQVRVVKKIKNSLMFEGESEGVLSQGIFHSIFSPFKVHQVVYHDFYGIGQIIPSSKDNVSAAVIFFANPEVIYDIDGVQMTEKDLKC
ncbi:hypothetical protein FZC83_02155 [Rossellomorea marisflavi]|uniref:Uncharacterized protein n=1 Tax=Rossellomorea marisflavi TaxID=189381 RepID=A0A5D4S0D8_9BACI|nr:hypothetical protein [Rossellomorea marisflavi]TYS56399.1 hypothetical protein FZC83_02155 [Rossellomorea marisflavi]